MTQVIRDSWVLCGHMKCALEINNPILNASYSTNGSFITNKYSYDPRHRVPHSIPLNNLPIVFLFFLSQGILELKNKKIYILQLWQSAFFLCFAEAAKCCLLLKGTLRYKEGKNSMKDNAVLKGVFMKGEYCALLGSWIQGGFCW